MSALKGKRILIFQQRAWAKHIGRFLARQLHQEGCLLASLTSTAECYELIKRQSEDEFKYELIADHDPVMGEPKKYLGSDFYSLQEICETLGIETIWPLVWSLRMFVRSYKDKYYYSFKQNLPDEEIITYIMALYKFVKAVFDEFQPDLIIAPNFVSLHHIMFNLYAQKHNVKMMALADSTIKGMAIFTYDFNESSGPFYNRVDQLNSGLVDSENRKAAQEYIREFREKFKKPFQMSSIDEQIKGDSAKDFLKGELRPIKQILLWYLKRPKNQFPSAGIWTGWRPPRIILRDHFAHKKYRRCAQRFAYFPLEKLKKFVYFPLQVQPETVVDVAAPYFSNQIETARQVAMSLPGDYTLVVKDHPAMLGLHPCSYLEKISRTVNVKLVDYRIPSEYFLRRCALLVSPGGASLTEAAFYQKPAVQLGNFGIPLKLPNVVKHTDITTISKKIKDLLNLDLNTSAYERRLENFVCAVYDEGYNINYLKMWETGQGDRGSLWQAYKKEIEKNF